MTLRGGGRGGGINSGMCGIRHLLERKDKMDFKLYPSITRKSYKCTSNLESLGFIKRIDFSIVTLFCTSDLSLTHFMYKNIAKIASRYALGYEIHILYELVAIHLYIPLIYSRKH